MAFLLGTIVGLALGLVGGGGSIITVPLLVGPLGVPAHEATTMSLIIVGVTAAWASAAHAQRGNVLWSHAIAFGAVGSVGTLAGGYLNRAVPARVLLAGFVVLMVVAAIATWRRATRTAGSCRRADFAGSGPRSARSRTLSSRSRSRATARVVSAPGLRPVPGRGSRRRAPDRFLRRRRRLPHRAGAGSGRTAPMSQAIGTSLPIIAMNSATALAGHLGTGISFEPSTTVLFTVGAVLAGLAGGALSTRLPAATLGRGFAVVVLTLAAYLSLQVV